MKTNTMNMTEGNLVKQILYFAFPIFVGRLFQQMYSTVDSLIVGNLLGAKALAAVASTGSLTFLIIGFTMGFSNGAGIVIARAIGSGDDERTGKAVHTAVAVGIGFSVVMSIAGALLCPTLLRLIATPDDVIQQSVAYLRVILGGGFTTIMYNTFTGILQAGGDSRDPLKYLIISSVLNILLDFLFIGVFHMGVAGAAYATILSQFTSMTLALFKLMGMNDSIRVIPKKISVDGTALREVVRFGLPTAMQMCVTDLANVMIQSYINSFGSSAMAGIGAYSRIEGFGFLPVNAFSVALSTFIGQNMGAEKYDRVKAGMRFALVSGLICAQAIGFCFVIFAPQLIGLFVREPEVIAFGVAKARISGTFYFLLAFSHLMSAIMRGIGKPMAPMVVMLTCWCLVRVLIFSTIGQIYHYIQLTYWIYPFTWFLSFACFTFYGIRLLKEGYLS